MNRVQISLLFAMLLLPLLPFAQAPVLSFRHISIEQGLSNSTIEAIYQDKRGFMWVGTRDGLNRYDGYQMVVYRFNEKDSNSISDNYIRFIYEDRHQQLWIGTINGLNRFDPALNRFVRYKHKPGEAGSLSHNLVTCLYEDSRGNFWVCTFGGGLNLYDRKKNAFVSWRHQQGKPKSLSDDRVNYVYEDARGNFWVATENGLNLFNRDAGSFINYAQQPPFNELTGNNVIHIIKEDRPGNLLLATTDNGLLVYNDKDKTLQQYRHQEKTPASLASNQVRSLLVDKKGDIWIGSVNGGLNLFNTRSHSFFHYINEPDNIYSLSQRTVSALFEDNQGNLWAGTHRGGLNLYTPNAEKFTLYRQEPGANSVSYSDVKSFCEDKQGNLWIGTDGGGLNLFNRTTNTFTHYKYDPYNNHTIGSNEVLHIMEDSEENLWISTWGGGLNLFNRHTNHFTRLHSLSSNYVQQVFEDHDGNLWVATYYGGLNLLDRRTGQFTRVTDNPYGSGRITGNNIVSLREDRQGNLWIGTDDGGLNCLQAGRKQILHYFNNEEKLPDLRVIFVDSKGRLWIGQNGLYVFDAKQNAFHLYTDKAGLAREFIKGITEDDMGNFWIATSNGLTRFHPETFSFKKYNTADGLQGLEFEANAYLKTKDGQMLFGGVNGFNAFYPENIKTNTYVPPVYITDFQIFNKKINPGEKGSPLTHDISVTTKVALSYKQSTFSLGFAALNYMAMENNQYAYKLEGWDKDWHYVDNERKASYTNLSPGTYTFKVKASNNDGIWNEQGTTLQLIITPPFWATWWFRALALAGALGGILAFFHFRRKMELRKLSAQQKEEMHQVQLQFFTNISHEFRTPLSLILGPVEKLQQQEDPASPNHQYYKVIYRNANRLMNLINELMDFRKSEAGVLKLHVMPGNIHSFLNEIYEEFAELAIRKNITFTIHAPNDNASLWFDRQIMEKIVINLLSNSFKHTADDGKITVEVLESLDQFKPSFENELVLDNEYMGKQYLYLRVADNGIGISEDSIVHLFERYYKINESHMGSGIGLAFVKSLTRRHKGHIRVYSERQKGTEIIVGIPVSAADYDATERWVNNQTEKGAQLESIQSKYEAEPVTAQHTEAPEDGPAAGNLPHILVVDDNDELRQFLRESLGEHYHITEAIDGHTGLATAKEAYPDLIISDIMMPGMDGIEFCRQIKEDIETSHIPFLMLTAKDALESRLQGVGSGADYYFSKPLSMQLLTLTLRNILQQKQKLKDRYFNDHYAGARELVHSKKDAAFMEHLISVIESHLINPDMDIDYICTQIGMSRTRLYQKIKSITGQSTGEFIRTLRLKKAAQLMTQQDVSLTEVMYNVGIQTQSYFTKAFKKEFGKTPSQFLKDLRK